MRRDRLKPFASGLITACVALAGVFGARAAADTPQEHIVALKDGGRLELHADGTMGHYDATGLPVPMKDGEIMVAADGTRIMMESEAVWRQIVEQAAIDYALAFTIPRPRDAGNKRTIELADGGRIVLRDDGTMLHFNAAGNRVEMKDAEVMTAKDGTRILMKNGTLWGALVDSGLPLRDRR